MYVYVRSEANLWTVGFFTPTGEWIAESDWDSRDGAALRVNWLNGGGEPSDNTKAIEDDNATLEEFEIKQQSQLPF